MLISEKLDDGFESQLIRILLLRPHDDTLIVYTSRLLVQYDRFNTWFARFGKAHLSGDRLLQILEHADELMIEIQKETKLCASTEEAKRLKEAIEELYVYFGELFDRHAQATG